ncbi:MAG: 16S rRNA (guanine(527)-N(7))-methyltransferase RsmG [Gammaproteobacteria bacterium]|nr:16S rRNA (guanine(527)-N(7))-methyltransferase RsmG [Gammaproteobacteria bacterium]
MTSAQCLQEALIANHLNVALDVQQKMLAFIEQMQKWNSVFNLTAIRDFEKAIWLHLVDSLSIHSYLHGQRIIDVGSGAGLPGIPLALLCPDKQFVLLDSNSKKTRFLQQMVYELGLSNVLVTHERVENYRPSMSFDSIMTRAFATLAVMLEKTAHLASNHGQFLAMKGAYPSEELAALPADFKVRYVERLNLVGLSVERHLVCIERSFDEKNSRDR